MRVGTARLSLIVFVLGSLLGAGCAAAQHLTPYKPAQWADKIVAPKTATTTPSVAVDSTPLISSDTLYVNYAVINDGTAASAVVTYYELSVDGVVKQVFNLNTAPPNPPFAPN